MADDTRSSRYIAEAGIGLGITQVCFGVICVICGIVLLSAGCKTDDSSISHGAEIWSGCFYILNGIFGITSGATRKKSWIIVFMIFCILCTCMVWVTLGYGAHHVAVVNKSYYHYLFDPPLTCSGNAQRVSKGCGGLMIIIALAEFVIAIVSAAFCCHGYCCCNTRQGGQVIYPTFAGPGYVQASVSVSTTTYVNQGPDYRVPIRTADTLPGVHAYGAQPVQPPPYSAYNSQPPPPAYGYNYNQPMFN